MLNAKKFNKQPKTLHKFNYTFTISIKFTSLQQCLTFIIKYTFFNRKGLKKSNKFEPYSIKQIIFKD